MLKCELKLLRRTELCFNLLMTRFILRFMKKPVPE